AVRHQGRHAPRLVQLPGAHVDSCAYAVRIILAATEPQCGQPYAHGEMRIATVVAEHVDTAPVTENDVLIAVAIDIGNEQRPDRIVLHRRRKQLAAVREPAGAVVVE